MKLTKKVIKYVKEATATDCVKKALIISALAIAGAGALHILAMKVLPFICLVLLILVPYMKEQSDIRRRQQEMAQQQVQQNYMCLYQDVAGVLLPILMEYRTALGIAPTTVNSLFSGRKFVQIPGVYDPICIYTVERKAPGMIPIPDIKMALQKRFNQENLWLYLRNIDERNSNYLTLGILPITSEDTRNWAIEDMQRQFSHTERPKNSGDKRDKDF